MLTTLAIGPAQLVAVWTLILQSEPEGPALISCTARLLEGVLHGHTSFAPSWRTLDRPDRSSGVRTDWPLLRRCPSRLRRACELQRKGAKAADHAAYPGHSCRLARLACRAS